MSTLGQLPAEARALRAIAATRLFDGEAMRDNATVVLDGEIIVDVVEHRDVPAGCDVIALGADEILCPGFIDVQVNGGGGVLLNDGPTLAGIAALTTAHRRFGTTGCLPTLITDDRAAVRRLADIAPRALALPGVLGFHLEGPFINHARKGVHPAGFIARATMDDLELLAPFGKTGRSLVTLAPEAVPGGFVAALVGAGLRVAAGHSDATRADIIRAMTEGLTGATHLFNAMSQMSARQPGVVGTVLDDARVYASIICDGYHVDPTNLRVAFRAKGRQSMMLVTDAMPTVGWTGSTFDLCGQTVTRVGDRLLTDDGTLAGAHLDMMTAVRRAVELMGVSLEDALIMASRTPAAFLGLEATLGRIRRGYRADLVAFDSSWAVRATWIAGQREPVTSAAW